MAQEVIRDWIYRYDEKYLNRAADRLSETGLNCRSCSREFKFGDTIHAQYKSRGSPVKRHLSCALMHHILDFNEAREIAPPALGIDFKAIRVQIPVMLEQRRRMFTRLACLALAVAMFGTNVLQALL